MAEETSEPYSLWPVGHVESELTDRRDAPMQSCEGAPAATLVFDDDMADAVADLQVGDEVLVLTWLHRARRDVLRVHPRDDRARPMQGVFSTRSPDRPNPVGVHRATVVGIQGNRVRIDALEAIDGTPVIDLKPVIVPSER